MIGIALFALTVGCIACLFGGGNKMPYYEGKSLEEWFDSVASYHSEEDPPVRAILAIGSDAVPFLRRELCVSESPWPERLRSLQCRLGLVRRPFSPASNRKLDAYNCLLWLGPKAEPALPQLIKISEDESHPSCRLAIELLGYFQSSPTTVIPSLERRIATPPDPRPCKEAIFEAAIISLAAQGTNARSALPRLKQIESDARIPVEFRIEAGCARLSIDPANLQPLDFMVAQWEDTNASGAAIVRALNHLGANSIPALPAMRKMTQSRFGTYESFALSNAISSVENFSVSRRDNRQ